jgi:hypothetical protein
MELDFDDRERPARGGAGRDPLPPSIHDDAVSLRELEILFAPGIAPPPLGDLRFDAPAKDQPAAASYPPPHDGRRDLGPSDLNALAAFCAAPSEPGPAPIDVEGRRTAESTDDLAMMEVIVAASRRPQQLAAAARAPELPVPAAASATPSDDGQEAPRAPSSAPEAARRVPPAPSTWPGTGPVTLFPPAARAMPAIPAPRPTPRVAVAPPPSPLPPRPTLDEGPARTGFDAFDEASKDDGPLPEYSADSALEDVLRAASIHAEPQRRSRSVLELAEDGDDEDELEAAESPAFGESPAARFDGRLLREPSGKARTPAPAAARPPSSGWPALRPRGSERTSPLLTGPDADEADVVPEAPEPQAPSSGLIDVRTLAALHDEPHDEPSDRGADDEPHDEPSDRGADDEHAELDAGLFEGEGGPPAAGHNGSLAPIAMPRSPLPTPPDDGEEDDEPEEPDLEGDDETSASEPGEPEDEPDGDELEPSPPKPRSTAVAWAVVTAALALAGWIAVRKAVTLVHDDGRPLAPPAAAQASTTARAPVPAREAPRPPAREVQEPGIDDAPAGENPAAQSSAALATGAAPIPGALAPSTSPPRPTRDEPRAAPSALATAPDKPAAATPTAALGPASIATPAPAPRSAEFDTRAAQAALSEAAARAGACRTGTDPTDGSARVSVTFAPSGRVTSATVNGPPFAGTETGGCIAKAFRSASVPAFEGAPVTVHKSVGIH